MRFSKPRSLAVLAIAALPLAGCSWFRPDLPPVQHVAATADAQEKTGQEPAPQDKAATEQQAIPAPAASDSAPGFDTARAAIAGDTITVTVTDPLPVRGARLIAPGGSVTEASAIDAERYTTHEDNGMRPRVGASVFGGSGGGVSTGIGIGFPLFGSGESRTWRETRSQITFRLPDAAAYRRDWQRYTIAVDLDDGVNRRSFQMLPPAPPTE